MSLVFLCCQVESGIHIFVLDSGRHPFTTVFPLCKMRGLKNRMVKIMRIFPVRNLNTPSLKSRMVSGRRMCWIPSKVGWAVPSEGVMGLGQALNTQLGQCSAWGGLCLSVPGCLVDEMRPALREGQSGRRLLPPLEYHCISIRQKL